LTLALAFAEPPAPARPAPPDEAVAARVRSILQHTPLVDGHNDLAEQYRDVTANHVERIDLAGDTSRLSQPLQTDIPRLRRGLVGGVFLAAYVPADLEGAAAIRHLIEQMDVIHRIVARYPNDLAFAASADDVERIHSQGKIACLIGIENGGGLGDSLAVLRAAHAWGARYVTLTHWQATHWADAGTAPAVHNGLTPFGREMVREMNRLGVLVDLSHVSDATMLDAMRVSQAPVIFSHSGARALCNHPRDVPDEILRATAAKRGIVMVNFSPGFLDDRARAWDDVAWPEWNRLSALYPADPSRARGEFATWRKEHPAVPVPLARVADHIEHIRDIAGVDHVGLGSDFDGISNTPVGLEDVSHYPALIAELVRRGWSDADLAKVVGGNILRVMREADAVARRLQAERPASDALIEELDPPAATPSPTPAPAPK
jgi:membrane dipeptidase